MATKLRITLPNLRPTQSAQLLPNFLQLILPPLTCLHSKNLWTLKWANLTAEIASTYKNIAPKLNSLNMVQLTTSTKILNSSIQPITHGTLTFILSFLHGCLSQVCRKDSWLKWLHSAPYAWQKTPATFLIFFLNALTCTLFNSKIPDYTRQSLLHS